MRLWRILCSSPPSRRSLTFCIPEKRDGLGDDFVASYLKLRRQHWDEYTAQLTPWELATYLDA